MKITLTRQKSGKLSDKRTNSGALYLTQDEIDEMFELVCDAATEQELVKARERGCNVFIGYEDESVH